ncbi:hypothetical protein G7085_15270 [Tessaracoccus sp. HDW20]|uniref:hypothetical protein n=1 Tax=Tessaracoccus coleopterorum TaxID=2714950 RepID=UPI0018D4C944|nr:hypothetical protein [Tessaracoccus coleopterorum]NHB85509.1 hypothetical protein [Tessaracoccus coleopterorum]
MNKTAAQVSERIVGSKAGQVPWAREAILVLRETASRYGATITYADLAEAVQNRSGVRTHAQQRTWLAGVLRLVATACQGRNLPPLTSLAVNRQDGQVGVNYDMVAATTGAAPSPAPASASATLPSRDWPATRRSALRYRRTRHLSWHSPQGRGTDHGA